MISLDKAKQIVLKKYSDGKIVKTLDTPTKFIFQMIGKNEKVSGVILDSFFYVDKKTGKAGEYAYLNDLENFKKAKEI